MIYFIAFGLAMDACAVALSKGMLAKKITLLNALKTGLVFGLFQGFMPLIGWLLGDRFSNTIEVIDHWLAFGLLSYIGINMIIESIKKDEDEVEEEQFNLKSLFILGFATSIDALMVGIIIGVEGLNIYTSAIIIAIITFIIASFGVVLGKKIGPLFKDKAGILGGIILILIGTQILLTHLAII